MDIKYLIDGDAVTIVGTSQQGVMVSKLYETHDDYGSFELGKPFIVDKVYDVVPTEIYEQKINELQARIDEKNEYLRTLSADCSSYLKQIKDYEKNKEKYPDLSAVLDIANGKELFVVYEDTLELKKYPDGCKDCYKDLRAVGWFSVWSEKYHRREMKLFLGQYSDFSGSRYPVRMFKTNEEAQDYLKIRILDIIKNERVCTIPHDRALSVATMIGFFPEEVLKAKEESILQRKQNDLNRITQLKEEIARIKKGIL